VKRKNHCTSFKVKVNFSSNIPKNKSGFRFERTSYVLQRGNSLESRIVVWCRKLTTENKHIKNYVWKIEKEPRKVWMDGIGHFRQYKVALIELGSAL